ncbi:MAG: hypothetical protein COY73_01175 [Candidatus Nealsonbacteria bacterium CG_4_10_14_0_8_um_filter_37_14]|uniref:peptidoglycan glycosyltransferase n=1 Tax=Candidatus Nealsonbacteria bacterium CG_4_10_14_0_8_um_filter_37_14 TaxID=1974684 RepID=A0A2M7R7I7_9BACT|nr:MAG: hypothetical protein COY73_01175 [Candidatus Nealsonbacteria bacterium CG_4_10_14_0_8_um_filter_37_14]
MKINNPVSNLKNQKPLLIVGLILLAIISAFLITGYFLQKQLITIYDNQNSQIVKDRNGQEIGILPNEKGNFARYFDKIPARVKELLIQKEDQYFYYHFGFNPWSIIRASLGYLGLYPSKASSTITQQLVKNLLKKETERSLKNKIIESFYTLSLETYQTKNNILKMYLNTIYFGQKTQGLAEASRLYFDLSPDLISDSQILQLLSTLSSPAENNPTSSKNKKIALSLAQKMGFSEQNLIMTDPLTVKENMKKYSHFHDTYFEIQTLYSLKETPEQKSVELTIDKDLTTKIRKIIERNLEDLKPKNAKNGAAIVVKLPENEILALIGSPNPQSFGEGYQINMLQEPRPIGSTIKPFIYLKAFEKGLRPYTLIDDREYKYITAIGFPLYPKNFDYKYRGEVNLHYALSNSLNVPTVKVLEYVGLQDFYNFLEKDLEFKPIQDLDNYQLGIALGALEMNLLDLAHYFTIFSNDGILKELKIYKNDETLAPDKRITEPEYIQLINKILNDRETGIEQFGLKSDLNLFQQNYALKTGTSRDFRDSWVIGYTPDFLVGVWLGNADNSPMDEVSGQVGAGRIWAEIMELLLNSKYNKKTPLNFDLIREFNYMGEIEYGLPNDNYQKCQNLLKGEDQSLILNPHDGDTFLLEENSKIILKAKENVKWFIDGKFLGEDKDIIFTPTEPGQYQIKAESSDGFQEKVNIWING